jgi:hypothetical protein
VIAVISGLLGFALGGLFVDGVVSILGVIVLITGLFAAAAREGAVLAGRSEKQTKRITAIGFYLGLAVSVLVLVIDAIWG